MPRCCPAAPAATARGGSGTAGAGTPAAAGEPRQGVLPLRHHRHLPLAARPSFGQPHVRQLPHLPERSWGAAASGANMRQAWLRQHRAWAVQEGRLAAGRGGHRWRVVLQPVSEANQAANQQSLRDWHASLIGCSGSLMLCCSACYSAVQRSLLRRCTCCRAVCLCSVHTGRGELPSWLGGCAVIPEPFLLRPHACRCFYEVRRQARLADEARRACHHCGTRETSHWRRQPDGSWRCSSCSGFASTHRGVLPPLDAPRCLECGSDSKGPGRGATWRFHPLTGRSWVCNTW